MSHQTEQHTVAPLLVKQPLQRYDTAPFLVLYVSITVLLSPLNPDQPSQALFYRIAFALALLAHIFLLLAQEWSILIKAKCQYSAAPTGPTAPPASHVLITPPPNAGAAQICPLQMLQNPADPSSPPIISASFQQQQFHSVPPPAPLQFSLPPFPISNPLSSYSSCRPHSTDKSLISSYIKFGSNEKELPLPTLPHLLSQQLIQPFFIFQVFCCMLWSLDEYWYYAIFTLFMLIFFESTVALQRLRGLQKLRATLKHPSMFFAHRGNAWKQVLSTELLVGDVISLTRPPPADPSAQTSTPQVPADLLLLSGSLIVNEAMLTGESVPQLKESLANVASNAALSFENAAHKKHVIFGGCVVVDHTPASDNAGTNGISTRPPDDGTICYVLRTGFGTAQGRLLRTMAYNASEPSPNTMDTFVFIAMLLCFAMYTAYYVVVEGLDDPYRNRFKLMLHTIIICTSVVPPELPMELALAVTNSLKSLMALKVFCTEPFRVPLGGRVEVCCFDKTGTLTSDEMCFRGVVVPLPADKTSDSASLTALVDVADATPHAVMCMGCCQSLTSIGEEVIGDPLEKAVLKAAGFTPQGSNAVIDSLQNKSIILKRFAFESSLARMSVIATTPDDSSYVCTKGSPESVKLLCKSLPSHYDVVSRWHMGKGRRVLAMAVKQIPGGWNSVKNESRESIEQDLTFVGFLVLDCPLKFDTTLIINELMGSNHRCVMITGDAVLTAGEVARKVGIISAASDLTMELQKDANNAFVWNPVVTPASTKPLPWGGTEPELKKMVSEGYALCLEGSVLQQLAGEESGLLTAPALAALSTIVPYVSVFARHAPRHKEAVVAALNLCGKFTMMCGDGTNDVGALKQAHVGISLISVPEVERKRREAQEGVKLIQKAEKLSKKLEKARRSGEEDKIKELEKSFRKAEKKARGEGGRESIKKKLREADDELNYVSLGDASVASPFTYRGVSIDCCKQVLVQGRCTLVIMLQIYKILGVNCLVTALILSKLTMLGVKQGDFQMTITGLVVAGFFFLISLAKPLQNLSASRPPSSVLCFKALTSIGLQFAVHYTCIIGSVYVSLPFLDPDDTSNTPDGPFNPTPLNSSTFLVALCVTINTFATNYVGHPFMQSLGENKLFGRGLALAALLLVTAALEAFPPLNDLLQMGPMPDSGLVGLDGAAIMPWWGVAVAEGTGLGLRGVLVAIMAVDTAGVAVLERIVNVVL